MSVKNSKKSNFIVPLDCSAADAVNTTINGYGGGQILYLVEKIEGKK